MEWYGLAGLILVFAGLLLIILSASGNVEFGGVIFLGPIPIPLGNNPILIGLSLLIGLTVLLVFYFKF